MWPGRVSNPGPLALESNTLRTALCGPAEFQVELGLRWASNPALSAILARSHVDASVVVAMVQ